MSSFQMLERYSSFKTWVVFTRALEVEFKPSLYDYPQSTLYKLIQIQHVNDFYLEFMSLANRVQAISIDALLVCFLSGLKPDICRDALAQSPTSITKVISFAKLFEEKYYPKPKLYIPLTHTRPIQPLSNS